VPSLRVLAVLVLIGMGATAAAVGGLTDSGESGADVRGSLIGPSPVGTAPAPLASDIAFDVQVENRLPGTTNWQISRARGTTGDLAGYASALSVTSGQAVPLSVSAAGPVRVRALRIGWYGGKGARQVWQGTIRAEPETGDPSTWPSRGFADTNGWPEGHYLLRLDQDKASRYLPLTVRSADNRGKVVVLTSPLTWQAENTPATPVTTAPAALPKISLNRPYTAGFGGAGFLEQDARILQLAERNGRSVGYLTDYDVATDPALLKDAAAVLVGGDSQYWPATLRTAVVAAGDAGTNLAFFGAGTGARRIRLTDAGRAIQISRAQPSSSVRLTGLRPACAASTTGWVVSNADWWGYQGAGLQTGDVLPGLISGRVDRAAPAASGTLLSRSPSRCASTPGSTTKAGSVTQSGLYLDLPSDAGVFTAGTGRWACALTGRCTAPSGRAVAINADTRRAVTRITRNVIKEFAEPKAGKRLPVDSNASQ
jgi:hypothetical protein